MHERPEERPVTLNLVVLLGWVAEPPREADAGSDTVRLTIATRTSDPVEDVQRHRVLAGRRLAHAARGLVTGQQVYLEGRFTTATWTDDRGRRQRRVEVVAHTLWSVDGSPPPPSIQTEPTGTHASPRQHTRTGHWRRIAAGRPEERLVWVRATVVGQATTSAR
jgi:single-stranded DNA-binding protein